MNDQTYESFFNEIYGEYHRAIYAYILTRVDNKEIAKELLQEAFLRTWNQIHVGYEMGRQHSRYWLFRIAKNLITDYYRRRTSREKAEERIKAESLTITRSDKSPEEAYEIKYQTLQIKDSMQNIPEDLRNVLIMTVIGQMNSSEIGEMLDVPPSTVRYRLSMARKLLQKEMKLLRAFEEANSE